VIVDETTFIHYSKQPLAKLLKEKHRLWMEISIFITPYVFLPSPVIYNLLGRPGSGH
jgi:hypothetical protein